MFALYQQYALNNALCDC